jgi:N-acetylmuramoyl-L-alanine amidase
MARKTRVSAVLILLGVNAIWTQVSAAESAKAYRFAQGRRAGTSGESSLPTAAGRMPEAAKPSATGPGADALEPSRVTAVRFLSSSDYIRVMMDLSQAVRYETHRLPEDPAKGLPPRIYVDIFGARLAMDSKEPIVVHDGLLRQVRVAQFSQDVVRVVLDMTSLRNHHTFLLPDPYRLVIDIQGQKKGETLAAIDKNKALPYSGKEKKIPRAGIKKIVLDPGHGGKDPGAIGVGGVAEKDIVLNVAKKLAKRLRNEMGLEVVLTRKDDTFVDLENRTAIANAEDADLFVSLHMNASPNGDAKGVETYYLDNTTDEASLRLAARENGTSRKNISDLQFILSDMTQNMKLEDSITLAHRLHASLVGGMSKKMGEVKDLGVKTALFYVLVGARMPSVLVEMFFITNKTEGRAMSQESYQDAMAEALFEGIQKYNQTTIAAKTL